MDQSWARVVPGDTVWTGQGLTVRFMCSACTVRAVAGTDQQFVYFWEEDGSRPVSSLNIPDGFSTYLMVFKALSPYPASDPGQLGFVDVQKMTVGYHVLTVTAPAGITGAVPAKLTAPPGVLARAQSIYVWQFNDGTPPATVTVTGDSTVTHAFPVGGPYTVSVTMRDPVRAPAATGFGTATVPVTAAPTNFAWRFTSATLVSSQLPPGGIGSEKSDTTIFNLFNGWSQSPVSYTHLRAHETVLDLVCRLLLEKKKHPHPHPPPPHHILQTNAIHSNTQLTNCDTLHQPRFYLRILPSFLLHQLPL